MDEADRRRLEGYRQQRVEALASISDIQRAGWRFYKTLGEGHPRIDVTYDRVDELEQTLEYLEQLIRDMDHTPTLRNQV